MIEIPRLPSADRTFGEKAVLKLVGGEENLAFLMDRNLFPQAVRGMMYPTGPDSLWKIDDVNQAIGLLVCLAIEQLKLQVVHPRKLNPPAGPPGFKGRG